MLAEGRARGPLAAHLPSLLAMQRVQPLSRRLVLAGMRHARLAQRVLQRRAMLLLQRLLALLRMAVCACQLCLELPHCARVLLLC